MEQWKCAEVEKAKKIKYVALRTSEMNENSLVGLSIAAHCSAILFHCSLSSHRQSCASHSSAPFDPMHMRARTATLTILQIDPGPGPGPNSTVRICTRKLCIFTFDLLPFIFIAKPFCGLILFLLVHSLPVCLSVVPVAPCNFHRHILSSRFMCLKHYCRVVKRDFCVFSSLKLPVTASGFTHSWTLQFVYSSEWRWGERGAVADDNMLVVVFISFFHASVFFFSSFCWTLSFSSAVIGCLVSVYVVDAFLP